MEQLLFGWIYLHLVNSGTAINMASHEDSKVDNSDERVSERDIIQLLYPSALSGVHCVPPLHFNKVPYSLCTVPGTSQSALMLSYPQRPPASASPALTAQNSECSASSAQLSAAQHSGGRIKGASNVACSSTCSSQVSGGRNKGPANQSFVANSSICSSKVIGGRIKGPANQSPLACSSTCSTQASGRHSQASTNERYAASNSASSTQGRCVHSSNVTPTVQTVGVCSRKRKRVSSGIQKTCSRIEPAKKQSMPTTYTQTGCSLPGDTGSAWAKTTTCSQEADGGFSGGMTVQTSSVQGDTGSARRKPVACSQEAQDSWSGGKMSSVLVDTVSARRKTATCSQQAQNSCSGGKISSVLGDTVSARRKTAFCSQQAQDSCSGGKPGQDTEAAAYNLWGNQPTPDARPESFQTSDAQDDRAQRLVLSKLRALAEGRQESVFIISQLQFQHYLSRPDGGLAIACLPRPTDLEEKDQRGEVDVLLVHRRHGILLGEIKSAGLCHPGQTEGDRERGVWRRVDRALGQLHKAERVVRHVLSDLSPGLRLRKTLFLPFVNKETLRRVLQSRNKQLEQAFAQCLGASSGEDVADLCCCSDHLSDSPNPLTCPDTPVYPPQLAAWWQHTFTCAEDAAMSDQLYLQILARFVGPATSVYVHCNIPPRVEVRTQGEAVAELGRRLARLVLTPQQLDLMNRAQPRVCLTGPPGTGKTIVLVLMGLRWLQQGEDVDILSPYCENRAASYMIQHQLKETLKANSMDPSTSGTVHLRKYNFNSCQSDAERALGQLSAEAQRRPLNILLDEAGYGSTSARSALRDMLEKLAGSFPGLRLWASSVDKTPLSPLLPTEALSLPLRCAPVIVREVVPAFTHLPHLDPYSPSLLPSPADGLRVTTLRHQGPRHSVTWPVDCVECGKNIADTLRQLGAGLGETITPNSPKPLSYRDVFILTRCSRLHDDVTDDAGNVTSPACGVVSGLRSSGLPLLVLGQKDKENNVAMWERDVADVATAASERVTVAHVPAVFGLERKVVVWLPGRDDEFDDDQRSQERIEAGDRLVIVSRSTTHLIRVH